jgi:hypothetical protein
MAVYFYSVVRSTLIKDWDPIGVRSFNSFDEDSESEYDSYATDITAILSEGGGLKEVKKYLFWAEDHIGLDVSPDRIERVARLLIAGIGMSVH